MQYYIAIVAPPVVNEKVLEWKKYMQQQFGCKVALKSPAHITLVAPFHMLPEKEAALTAHLQQFSSGETSFTIQLRHFNAFRPRIIFVAVTQNPLLLALKERLDNFLLQLTDYAFKKEERPFHPHVTIANRDLDKKDFPRAWEHFRSMQYKTSFQADAISLLRHNKVHWEIAAKFPFAENA